MKKTKGKFPWGHHVIWNGKTKCTSWKGLLPLSNIHSRPSNEFFHRPDMCCAYCFTFIGQYIRKLLLLDGSIVSRLTMIEACNWASGLFAPACSHAEFHVVDKMSRRSYKFDAIILSYFWNETIEERDLYHKLMNTNWVGVCTKS